jgi:glycosyltransferase involved in cell wall biosynthesis
MSSLVSIIIPTFNRAGAIKRAIYSCLNQTYQNIEIIVVDDASNDNTFDVVNSIGDNRIRYYKHKLNKGAGAARNTGLANVKGEYVALLDSDDEWHSQKVQLQLDVFKISSCKIGLLFTNGYSYAKKRNFFLENERSGIVYDSSKDKFFPLSILVSPPSSWMIPLDVVREIGYFNEEMYNWEDGDYLTRIAYKYPLYFLNENLINWHIESEHLNKMGINLIAGKELFLRNNYDFMKKDREYLFRFYKTLGKDALSFDGEKARKYLLKAFLMRPYDFSILSKFIRSFTKK